MIRHIVLAKFKAEVTKTEIDSLFAKLADLKSHIPGMRGFDGGVSVSPEGLEQGFRHGFSIDFDDAEARDAYLEHPEHKALGGQLVGLLEGGVAGLVVFDMVVGGSA
ncbi:Dabb family protein [Thalassospira tepidiphila]|jgi:hypothetical protein|uniref:Dabb family protein n=1 Tax=Thalassospira tepidiphila TaxID=393657 RepID=UPI001BD08332|nr:Dabb family protein [Thalassospira tepidiphila]MBS8272343.1 Dabb family protein [Thalassospira tepidiphila]